MANTQINIIKTAINGDWCNVQTVDGKEIGINIKSNPITGKILENGEVPSGPIEVNLVEKAGKFYGWDIKPQQANGGGKNWPKETPEEKAAKIAAEEHKQRMIVAQSSVSASVQFYQGKGQVDTKMVKDLASELYFFVMDLSK